MRVKSNRTSYFKSGWTLLLAVLTISYSYDSCSAETLSSLNISSLDLTRLYLDYSKVVRTQLSVGPSYGSEKSAWQRSDEGKKPKKICFREAPYSECRTFWITDFSFSDRIGQSSKLPGYLDNEDTEFYATWELGWMRNLNPNYSLGATLLAGLNDEAFRLGLKIRIRRWLSRHLSLDFAPGIPLLPLSGGDEKYPGFTSHLGLNLGRWIALIIQLEATRAEAFTYDRRMQKWRTMEGSAVAWYAGMKLRSEPGVVSGLAGLFLAFIFTQADFSGLD